MKKILVIDDDPDILDVVKMILESHDYDVLVSENANIFGLLDGHLPDLILLDILLSGEDGRDLAKRIKKNKKTEKIPIVMLSAYPDARKSTIEAGANDFISKPFEVADLLMVVERNIKN